MQDRHATEKTEKGKCVAESLHNSNNMLRITGFFIICVAFLWFLASEPLCHRIWIMKGNLLAGLNDMAATEKWRPQIKCPYGKGSLFFYSNTFCPSCILSPPHKKYNRRSPFHTWMISGNKQTRFILFPVTWFFARCCFYVSCSCKPTISGCSFENSRTSSSVSGLCARDTIVRITVSSSFLSELLSMMLACFARSCSTSSVHAGPWKRSSSFCSVITSLSNGCR